MTYAGATTDYRIARIEAEGEALGRDVGEIRQAIQAMDSRSRDDSGRLARVETALGSLGDSVRELAAATREQTAQLRGGIERAIGLAEAAGHRADANAERIDAQAERLDTLSQRIDTVEGGQRDARTSRRTLLSAAGAIAVTGGALNAFGVRDWLLAQVRQALPGGADPAEDGAGDSDDDRLDL